MRCLTSKAEVVEWWMPPSMMHLFKRDICLQNSMCFTALLPSWWIFSLNELHRCLWVCACVSILYVSNYCVFARKRDFIRFHVSLLISKTDEITNKSYPDSFSPLIIKCINVSLFGWASFWNITHITLFPLISHIFGSTRKHTHTHILSNILSQTHIHTATN